MKRILITVLPALLLTASVALAQSPDESGPKASAEQKATIVALQLMNHTLGQTQEKVAPRLAMMKEYLKEQNLVEPFVKSQADSQANPALLGFDDAVAAAIAHVKENNVAAESEFDDVSADQADRDIKGLQALVEPRFEEVQQSRGTVQRIAAFLKDNGQLAGYMDWALKQHDQQQADQAQTDDANRQKDEAAAEADQKRGQQMAQQAAAQEHADKQAALQRQFELQEQSMKSEAEVESAKYSGGGYDPYYYGGWGDPYHDVPHGYYGGGGGHHGGGGGGNHGGGGHDH